MGCNCGKRGCGCNHQDSTTGSILSQNARGITYPIAPKVTTVYVNDRVLKDAYCLRSPSLHKKKYPGVSFWNGMLRFENMDALRYVTEQLEREIEQVDNLDLQENERLGCIEVMDQNGSRELGAQASATFSNGQVRAANLPPSFYRTLRALPFGVQKTVIFHVVNSQLEIIRHHAYRFRTLPPLGIVARNPGSSRLDMGSGPEVQIANGMNGMSGNSFAANGCSSTHTASESSRLSFILTLSLSFILLFRMRKNTIRG